MALLRCPAQFCEFRSEIFASCFNLTAFVHKWNKPANFFNRLSEKLWSLFCIFFGSLYRSYLSDKNKTKEIFRIAPLVKSLRQKKTHTHKPTGQAFHLLVWFMIKTVSKNHIQLRAGATNRGIAKQRLRQHLGWPSCWRQKKRRIYQVSKARSSPSQAC